MKKLYLFIVFFHVLVTGILIGKIYYNPELATSETYFALGVCYIVSVFNFVSIKNIDYHWL